ncbi:hypothetical protein ACWGTI_18400 [Mesorhizobium sp. ArgA1]
MNAAAPTSDFPATLRDWEHTLTRALLRADSGNADPIRSFEITPEALAKHCGHTPDRADEAELAFKQALVDDRRLYWCLQYGRYWPTTSEVPNCMAILALSLLVDSLLDGEYEGQGQYRAKLAQWLGTHRSLMNLRGIAAMWVGLAAWLDGRVESGAPFRRLVLPDIPKTWTHIGYTRYLSFPTKRDVTLLRRQVERNPDVAEDPGMLVRVLDPLVRSNAVSYGLKGAFEDFRGALRAGAASIDHRFWRLVTFASQLAGHNETTQASLFMEFNEDGERHYWVKTIGASNQSFPPDLGDAVVSQILGGSQNLGPSIRRGILFFRSSGLASWSAVGEPPMGSGPFHLAIADRHIRSASSTGVRFERSGTWHVTSSPVAQGVIADVLSKLGIRNAEQIVRAIDLAGGVRVGKAWLGWPRYLPLVEGAAGDVEVRPLSGDNASTLACIDGALRADHLVDGDFAIGDSEGRWSRRASFVPMAEAHASLEAAAYSQPRQAEWRLASGRSDYPLQLADITWADHQYEHQDMLEALYASGRSGIPEGEAVAIVDRAVRRRTWDMLRALQESSFLDGRLRERWRGRVFTLGHPTLAEIKIDALPAVVVSGALPSRLEQEFRATVALQGGTPFRRLLERSQAPALVGALHVNATKLADALGWTVAKAPPIPDGNAAARLIETAVVGKSYVAAGAWDWSLGRFRAGASSAGTVSLVRFVHPGRRDHDLYRVTGARQRTFTSRHAAVLDAHLQAGLPLFRLDGDRIRRIPAEGALPLEVAVALRLKCLNNGGISTDGWDYAVSPDESRWLVGLMPGLIEGVRLSGDADPARGYRRGRGSRRPLWIGGSIEV